MTTSPTSTTPALPPRLVRPRAGRVLGGVATAIADRIAVPVGLVRLGFLVSVLFGGLGILLYVAGWLLIPDEGRDSSAVERWLSDLETPGRRLAAVMVGILAALVLAGIGRFVLIVALLAVGLVALVRDRRPHPST